MGKHDSSRRSMLWGRNDRLSSIGVSALYGTRIDRGRRVTVSLAVRHGTIRLGRGRIYGRVDLRISATRAPIRGAIEVIPDDVRGSAPGP